MFVIPVLLGLGCAMLLAAITLVLLRAARGRDAPSPGAHAAARGAAGVFAVGALLAWGSGLPALESLVDVVRQDSLQGPVLSLVLMAALAIPLRVTYSKKSSWSSALLYLPAWLFALWALACMTVPGGVGFNSEWVTPLRFCLAVCAGVGARSAGHSLQLTLVDDSGGDGPGALAYGLITTLTGSAGMLNLAQRGAVWAGCDPMTRGGLAGVWMAWTADWLMPRRYPRLRALTTVVAVSLLVVAAVNPS